MITSYPVQSEKTNVAQYEAVFLQLADEHRTVNAFELHELLEACLPNGELYSKKALSVINIFFRLHQELRQFGRLPAISSRV